MHEQAFRGGPLSRDLATFNIMDGKKLTTVILKAMYKAYSLELHPDKAVDPKMGPKKAEEFKQMKDAYDRLLEYCNSKT